jgi:antitoxin FitA
VALDGAIPGDGRCHCSDRDSNAGITRRTPSWRLSPFALPDEAHRALQLRAARRNRSTEAAMRAIREAALRPEGRLWLATALRQIGLKCDITQADIEAVEQARERRPAEPMTFD